MKFIIFALILSAPALSNAQKYSEFEVLKVLSEASNQLNKSLPLQMNRAVRLDTSFPGPGLVFTYVLTFGNHLTTGKPASVDDYDFEKIKNGLCNDSGRRAFLENGVTFRYLYRDQKLKPAFEKRITASDCGIKSYI